MEKAGAMGLVKKNKGVQAVYGPKADVLKSDIMDVLSSNAPIPESKLDETPEMEEKEVVATDSKGLATAIFPVAKGDVLPITEVNDEVFAQKMMGDGYEVNPSSNTVVSPVDGTIQSVFQTKHAIGIETASGIKYLFI